MGSQPDRHATQRAGGS